MAETEVAKLLGENARLQKEVAELQRKLGQLSKDGDGASKMAKVVSNEGRRGACEGVQIGHGLPADMIRRYSRQVLLPSFGVQGQERLLNSSVLVVGAGGLGSPAALYLAAAGFGRLGIVDRDTVELNNLHRQVIHTEASIGFPKVTSAATACRDINSSLDVREHHDGLDAGNAVDIISQYDVVVDATDNLPSRYIINDACVIAGKPLVSGAALGLDGQLSVYNYKNGPCYRCLFPAPPPQAACQRCSDSGVLGIVPGVIGCLQALEAIKVASGLGKPLSSALLVFDAELSRIQTVRLRGRNPKCVACGDKPEISHSNMQSFDYEVFTQSTSSDEAPGRIQRLPPSLGVSCTEYKRRRDQGEAHLLLDVRSRNEFSIVSLPDAMNVPFSDLGNQVEAVRSALAAVCKKPSSTQLEGEHGEDVPIFVICRRGNDSQSAVQLLRASGLTSALDITGGLVSWAKDVCPEFPLY